MKKHFFHFFPLFLLFTLIFTSCSPSDTELQESIISAINNKDIMVDVTDGHVTLSGFIYNTKDTIGFSEKILAIEGILSMENNISYFNKEELENEN